MYRSIYAISHSPRRKVAFPWSACPTMKSLYACVAMTSLNLSTYIPLQSYIAYSLRYQTSIKSISQTSIHRISKSTHHVRNGSTSSPSREHPPIDKHQYQYQYRKQGDNHSSYEGNRLCPLYPLRQYLTRWLDTDQKKPPTRSRAPYTTHPSPTPTTPRNQAVVSRRKSPRRCSRVRTFYPGGKLCRMAR